MSLSNFYFQLTKTLYKNNFNHIAFFFTLFEGYKCNKFYEMQWNLCQADTTSGPEINVSNFPLKRTPIQRTPLLGRRGH